MVNFGLIKTLMLSLQCDMNYEKSVHEKRSNIQMLIMIMVLLIGLVLLVFYVSVMSIMCVFFLLLFKRKNFKRNDIPTKTNHCAPLDSRTKCGNQLCVNIQIKRFSISNGCGHILQERKKICSRNYNLCDLMKNHPFLICWKINSIDRM